MLIKFSIFTNIYVNGDLTLIQFYRTTFEFQDGALIHQQYHPNLLKAYHHFKSRYHHYADQGMRFLD